MEASLVKAILESKVESLPILAVDLFLEPALNKLVADSANPIDDAIKAMVYAPLKKELASMLAEYLEKLKA